MKGEFSFLNPFFILLILSVFFLVAVGRAGCSAVEKQFLTRFGGREMTLCAGSGLDILRENLAPRPKKCARAGNIRRKSETKAPAL